ncbi:hypothetical protein [Algivirga pacifica]|uniref:Uncharacterized protein n=1 Tax=Algivirga pacifica TaxID=1162670 RepID=A0ABP9D645_9BACT
MRYLSLLTAFLLLHFSAYTQVKESYPRSDVVEQLIQEIQTPQTFAYPLPPTEDWAVSDTLNDFQFSSAAYSVRGIATAEVSSEVSMIEMSEELKPYYEQANEVGEQVEEIKNEKYITPYTTVTPNFEFRKEYEVIGKYSTYYSDGNFIYINGTNRIYSDKEVPPFRMATITF